MTKSIGPDDHAKAADFIIYREGEQEDDTHFAVGHDGSVAYRNTDVGALINEIIAAEGRFTHIHLTSGYHHYETTAKCYGGMHITGAGIRTTRYRQKNGANVDAFALADISDESSDQTFVLFRDMIISGNRNNNTAGRGFVGPLNATTVDDSRIKDVHFEKVFFTGFPEHGIHTNHTHGWRLTNSLIEFSDGDAIRVEAGPTTIPQFHVTNLFISDIGGYGINCIEDVNALAWDIDATITDCVQSGMRLHGVNESTFHVHLRGCDRGMELYAVSENNKFDGTAIKNTNEGVWWENSGGVRENTFEIETAGNGDDDPPILHGQRNVLGDNSVNNGDPSSGGNWNGHGRQAFNRGVTVYDYNSTAPETGYEADRKGNWQQTT